jgi:hypothetical protein
MTPSSEIHFWHIPKSAGTSVASLIRRAYPASECIPAHTARDLLAMKAADIPNYRCFTGHFFSLLEPLVGRRLPTVTILRDPVEQTLSLLRHCQRYVPGAGFLAPLLARSLPVLWECFPPIRSRIENAWCPVLMNNFQTRVLAGEFPMPPQIGPNFYCLTYPFLERSFCSPEADMDALYARAVQRLESMVVVGTVERLEETVRQISRRFGLPRPRDIPRENVSRYRTHRVSAKFLALLEEQNRYDFRLHRLATELLERDLSLSPHPSR